MSKARKPNKGLLIVDEGTNRTYVGIASSCGWKIKNFSPEDRNKSIPDSIIALKYARGIHPIFSSDKTSDFHNPSSRGASGYVYHETAHKDEAEKYEEKVREFFTSHSSRDVKGKIITISLKEPIVKKMNQK